VERLTIHVQPTNPRTNLYNQPTYPINPRTNPSIQPTHAINQLTNQTCPDFFAADYVLKRTGRYRGGNGVTCTISSLVVDNLIIIVRFISQ
jgi:hypothetical protein